MNLVCMLSVYSWPQGELSEINIFILFFSRMIKAILRTSVWNKWYVNYKCLSQNFWFELREAQNNFHNPSEPPSAFPTHSSYTFTSQVLQ